MLSEVKIENVAVIEKHRSTLIRASIVLTGETGAGKSILIDSIQAIMGSRVSSDLVRTGARKACDWATFEQNSGTGKSASWRKGQVRGRKTACCSINLGVGETAAAG